MTNLFCNKLIVFVQEFECLSENRVEWFVYTSFGTLILSDSKSSHKKKSFLRIFFVVRLLEKRLVVHDFTYFLEHRDRFIEIDRHTKFGQIFANSILDDFPHRYIDVGGFE